MKKSLPWKCIAWGWMFSGVANSAVRFLDSGGDMFYFLLVAMGIAALTHFTLMCEVYER